MTTSYAPYTATLPCSVPGCGWVAEATRRMNPLYKLYTDKGDEAHRRMVTLAQNDAVADLMRHLGHKHLGPEKGWEAGIVQEAKL